MHKKNDLTENDFLLTILLKNTTDIIICLNNAYEIVLFNYKAEQFFHWVAFNVIGKNFLQLCNENNYQSPVPENFLSEPIQHDFIQELRNGVDKICTIHWVIIPLLANSQYGVLLIGKDVAFKKDAIGDYVNDFIASTPGSLYWKDQHGRYVGCNDFMVKTAGLNTTHDIVGKTDYDLWPESAEKLVQNDQYAIETGKTLFLEEKVKIASGKEMYFTSVKTPLKNPFGEIVGLICNSLDISQFKQTKQLIAMKNKAEEANLIKTEFIRNMQHDIRTPFNGVVGLADYLLQIETDVQKRELLKDISFSAKELLGYCNNILDFDRIDSNPPPLLEKNFNLKKLVDSVIAIETPAAKSKQLALILDYSADLYSMVIGDSYRLQRILINLVSNSIKFTMEGAINLNVRLEKKINRDLVISFEIKDTGIGIAAEKQEFIFEKFARLNPSNQGNYKGLGLGLRIVKQFVEEMDGDINLISELGKGSSFKCVLPFKLPLLDS